MTLSSRISSLTGPDRAVDAEVAAAAKAGLPSGCDWAFKFPNWEADLSRKGRVNILGNVNGNGDYIAGHFLAPAFSASLDAAMSVVPDGWLYEAQQGPSGQPHIWNLLTIASGDVRYTRVSGRAATPALALLAAALKARGL